MTKPAVGKNFWLQFLLFLLFLFLMMLPLIFKVKDPTDKTAQVMWVYGYAYAALLFAFQKRGSYGVYRKIEIILCLGIVLMAAYIIFLHFAYATVGQIVTYIVGSGAWLYVLVRMWHYTADKK